MPRINHITRVTVAALFVLFALLAAVPHASLAASVPIANPGFETGNENGWYSGGSIHGVSTTNPHSGTYAAYNNGGWNSVFQTVSGLQPNTQYTLTAWGRLGSSSTGNNSAFYVDKYGGSRLRVYITGTSYQQYSITFTTGASNTSVELGQEEVNGTSTVTYFDDFALNSGSSSPTATPTSPPAPTVTPTPAPGGTYGPVTKIRFYPRSGFASRMLNGRFTGSNTSQTNDFTPLVTISATPPENQWTELTVSGAAIYRFLKYESPAGGWGNVAEIEFYSGTTKLSGTGFGTAGSWNNSGNDYTKALDGNTSTFFDAASGDDQYVGIDQGSAAQAAAPTFSPQPGSYSSAQNVTLSSATSGASIRYTTDGSTPSPSSGTLYSGPISVSSSKTIRAIAYKSGLANSTISAGVYTIGGGPTPTPGPGGSVSRVYHIGNSVTDTINYGAFRTLVQSKGGTYDFGRDIIPGAPLDWIWDHPTDGFSESPYGLYPNALPNYRWDAVTLQPFDRHLDSDTDYAKRYIDLARQYAGNGNTQFYIYSRWPRKNSDGTLNYDQAWLRTYTGGWDGTEETKDYFEKLVNSLRGQTGYLSKPILMIPAGDVLYELNQRMHAGQIPGFTDVTQLYADGIHLNNVGAFAVGSTFYATIYKTDPRGASYAGYDVINNPATDRDITDALASAIQQCVWDVVSTHPYAGLR